jgi:hypothetical protein
VVTLDLAAILSRHVFAHRGSDAEKAIVAAIGGSLTMQEKLTEYLRGKIKVVSDLSDMCTVQGGIRLATRPGTNLSGKTQEEAVNRLLSADITSDQNHRDMLYGSMNASFANTGVLVAYRDITQSELERLRKGETLETKTASIRIGIDEELQRGVQCEFLVRGLYEGA